MKSNVSSDLNLNQLNFVVEVLAMTRVLNWEFEQPDYNSYFKLWSATLIETSRSGDVLSINAQLSFEYLDWVGWWLQEILIPFAPTNTPRGSNDDDWCSKFSTLLFSRPLFSCESLLSVYAICRQHTYVITFKFRYEYLRYTTVNCSHTSLCYYPLSNASVTTLWKSLVLDLGIVVFANLLPSTFPYVSPCASLSIAFFLLVSDRLVFCLILFVICFGIDVFEDPVIMNNLFDNFR